MPETAEARVTGGCNLGVSGSEFRGLAGLGISRFRGTGFKGSGFGGQFRCVLPAYHRLRSRHFFVPAKPETLKATVRF